MGKLRILVAMLVPVVLAVTPFPEAVDDAVTLAPEPPVQAVSAEVSAAAALPAAVVTAPDVASVPLTPDGGAIAKEKAWDKIDFESRKLTNNVWGAPDDEKLTCSVFLNPDGTFGSSWSRPEPKIKSGITVKPIYPNVRIGGSPWDASNSAYFPVRLSDVRSLTFSVTYRYPAVPTGTYNLAYDLFFVDTSQPSTKPRVRAEVMIWLHGTRQHMPVTYKGDFSDGISTYELYSWVMLDGRQYYSFVMKGAPTYQGSHTVDARKLLDALSLDPAWYIPGVELGNEIWDGSGRLEITHLSGNMNGSEL